MLIGFESRTCKPIEAKRCSQNDGVRNAALKYEVFVERQSVKGNNVLAFISDGGAPFVNI